ncbi:unnamed protein product [Didymodactylos carnosus]|uniref:Uncharacterized protein n=1 Tax=Didymodactylos carnosus TaxID=1234261 RepID=A0A814AWZ5_9BILA|nr:unnamed protein product [Didymodactylos carnosus]CAF0918692.1 unnamed protein product [Didymodactylos carnosus]CAF3640763.1 unnamed protein product [Didymodactylos carnosus]CAF3698451.1 unnamed protein product [Didymodactylos carnosus]
MNMASTTTIPNAAQYLIQSQPSTNNNKFIYSSSSSSTNGSHHPISNINNLPQHHVKLVNHLNTKFTSSSPSSSTGSSSSTISPSLHSTTNLMKPPLSNNNNNNDFNTLTTTQNNNGMVTTSLTVHDNGLNGDAGRSLSQSMDSINNIGIDDENTYEIDEIRQKIEKL